MKTPSRTRFLFWILLSLPGWAVSAQDDAPSMSSIFSLVRADLEEKMTLPEPPEGLKPWTGEQDQEEVQRIAWSDAFGSGTTADVEFDAQDRLRRQGAVTYTYNQSGQRLTKKQNGQTVTYDYDHLGNLRRVELPDRLVIEYLYDAWGRRIGKKVNGVLVQGFLYGNDALGPIAELDGDGNLKCFFLYGLTAHVPDAMLCGGQLYKVVKDPLGHVRLIDNVATGQAVQRLDYDPFGRVLLDTNPGFQPFAWAGGLYERQTGLIHFGARDYDPEIGRWTAKDPRNFGGGDTNLYAYAGNDPINNIDPTGEAFLPALLVGGWMIYDVVDSFLAWKDATDALGRYGFSQETLADWTLASGNLILSVLDGPTNAGALLRAAPNGGVLDRFGGFDDAVGAASRFEPGHSASSVLKGKASRILLRSDRGLQKFFTKHGEDFGLTGDWNPSRVADASRALHQHINSSSVRQVTGTYRGQPVIHHLDPATGLNVIEGAGGNFVSGWRLSAEQLESVLSTGRLF